MHIARARDLGSRRGDQKQGQRRETNLDRREDVPPAPESLGLQFGRDLFFQYAFYQVLTPGQPRSHVGQLGFLGRGAIDGLLPLELAVYLVDLPAKPPDLAQGVKIVGDQLVSLCLGERVLRCGKLGAQLAEQGRQLPNGKVERQIADLVSQLSPIVARWGWVRCLCHDEYKGAHDDRADRDL